MPILRVVAALLTRGEKIFVQKRGPKAHLPNLWEFPGGKVEREETKTAALVRECQEELGVTISVGSCVGVVEAEAEGRALELTFFWASLPDDTAKLIPTAAVESLWLRPSELPKLSFCPADRGLVEALASGALPFGFRA